MRHTRPATPRPAPLPPSADIARLQRARRRRSRWLRFLSTLIDLLTGMFWFRASRRL